MTFTVVGSAITPVVTGLTFPLTPGGVGDVIVIEVISTTAADYATALSSSNVTWDAEPLVAGTSLPANGVASAVFKGEVTAASEATVTVATAAGTPSLRVGGLELSTTAGYSAVTLDTSGTVNSATTLCPDLTPGHGAGEAYFYFGFNASSSAAGSSSGYTFTADGGGNGLCYDADCTDAAQQPAFGASDTISGIAVLLYESGGGGGGTTGLVQETSGSSTTTSLTLTFPSAVTTGNSVIVALAGYYDGTVSGISIGSTAGTFTHVAGAGGSGGNNAGVFCSLAVAESSAEVTVTTSAAGILGWAYEVAGAVNYDNAEGGTGTGTSWSSGATPETIPYPHLVVGCAAIIANTGTITPPSGGWVNGTAYRDVSGASGHAIGGVSGYQQPSSSGTYTYSGTSSASGAWGAVTATFLVVPAAGWYWGGVLFNEHASAGYTGISCAFTIPESVPYVTDSLCSIWVGLGDVYQTGIYLSPDSAETGNVGTSPWSWWLGGGGGAGELWDATAFPTGAGDSLTLSLSYDSQYWYAVITNSTRDWTYTEVKSVLGNNLGCWAQDADGNPTTWGWIYPVGQAEIVIEQEGNTPNQLPDYGSIAFTAITTTPAITQAPLPLFPVWATGDGINEYPGPFNVADGTVTMHWNKYD